MFSRILVCARGEIALRIIRACKELGIAPVAAYSEEDRNAIYLDFADERICIGPGPSDQSYLNIPAIISAAEIADVEAIHPGYGFLSEVSRFAEVCRSCNLEFIGPSAEAMSLMGDKVKAREIAMSTGVPVVPGSKGAVSNDDEAVRIAHDVGYPVVVKAGMGGGGWGMRVAHNDMSLKRCFNVAESEAEAAFGDKAVYLEKYVTGARHVEIQLLGDHHGNVIHLGDRDCSLQRRHQKLIEEAPCPAINEDVREQLGEAAIAIAKTVDYYGAGTVEFLVDKDGNFYFIEMNCRIQVEHPVTEMVTGVDILREQLRIASGERLSLRQEDVSMSGVAIECRINAEDPITFQPSPGTISRYYAPGGPGVRVDSHAYAGCRVSPQYDSLVSKLIVHRRNRREAIACMQRALEEYVIEGVRTTIPLYLEIFGHSAFLSGRIDTKFVESVLDDGGFNQTQPEPNDERRERREELDKVGS
ncbi:MAG: acetyl-CoA carboxylase biotin carboxylase subunit [Planctomycetota bacterium]